MQRELQTRAFEMREFAITAEGRAVEGLVVPYGETASVVTRDGPITEMFAFGAFRVDVLGSREVGNAHWVKLTLEHNDSIGNRLGYAQELEETEAGLRALFTLYPSEAEKAREIIGETHKGLSVGFFTVKARPNDDGVIVRTEARLDHVAVTPVPAYESARVLALREQPGTLETPHLDQVAEYLDTIRAVG